MEPENTSQPQNPVDRQEPLQPVENPNRKKPLNKKILVIIAAAILVVVLLIAFIMTRGSFIQNQPSPPPEKATSLQEDLVLATVGGENISVMDLNHFASENLGARKLDSDTLKGMLDVLVERRLLDQEAEARQIQVSPPNGVRNENYYDILRERLTQGQVTSAEVVDIGWWLPPLDEYEQTDLSQRQRAEQEQASLDIEQRLLNNVSTDQILDYVVQTYPSIAESLSINGTKYEGSGSLSPDVLTRTHELNEDLLYLPRYQAIFALSTGEVSRNIWEDGSGADIIKAINVNRGEGESYEKWLERNILEKVTFNQEAIESL